MSDMEIWQISIALALVVALVVVALLWTIVKTAKTIEGVAGLIWAGGGRIASHTVHIPELAHTNAHVKTILGAAPALLGALERIRGHAEGCPSCPACVVNKGRL